MSTSDEIISNLQSQIKIYQETLEQLLENGTSSSNITNNIITRPRKGYIKSNDILSLFNITKQEYNNILSEVRFCMIYLHLDFTISYKDQDISLIFKIIEKVMFIFFDN